MLDAKSNKIPRKRIAGVNTRIKQSGSFCTEIVIWVDLQSSFPTVRKRPDPLGPLVPATSLDGAWMEHMDHCNEPFSLSIFDRHFCLHTCPNLIVISNVPLFASAAAQRVLWQIVLNVRVQM